jgi:hypothetical protein
MDSIFNFIEYFTPEILQFYNGSISLAELSNINYTDAVKVLDFYLNTIEYRITESKKNV